MTELLNNAQNNCYHDVQEPIMSAGVEVRTIIERVCQLEKNRLDCKNNGHINEDILIIIKEVIFE